MWAMHWPGMSLAVEPSSGCPTPLQIEFGQIYVSRPMYTEGDGETAVLFPKEARLRNLTYAAPL